MTIKILGTATDVRTATSVVYTQMGIPDYLRIVGDDFEDFHLQRRRETHKAYERLKADIRDGALLPSITLAVKPESVQNIFPKYEAYKADTTSQGELASALNEPGSVDILDGLQRTFIMKDLQQEGQQFKEGQRILVEFWLEANLHNLIYRIIVLNAGQKPMSIRHQLELLFASLQASIIKKIPSIEIYRERDATRRSKPRKFAFNVIVSAYQALTTSSPELQKSNIVANQLMESSALDLGEAEVSQQFDNFISALTTYSDLDAETFRIYKILAPDLNDSKSFEPATEAEQQLPANLLNWFATENVMVSFFAAISQFGSSGDRKDRIDKALDTLRSELNAAEQGVDVLGLGVLNQLRSGISARKFNLGVSTRRLLTNGFKEYFRDAGETRLAECWSLAAD